MLPIQDNQEPKEVPARAAGGVARAEAMTPEERKESARQAAMDRWDASGRILKVAFGSPEKTLKIIKGVEIEAYVLDNGQRVLSGRGMQKAFGIEKDRGAIIEDFLSKKDIKPLVSEELTAAIKSPISFRRPHSHGTSIAFAYEATILKKICDVILEARRKGALKTDRDHLMAKQAEILLSAFAEVGIIALVDEATGYQAVRDREDLQKFLEKFVKDEWAKWTKQFPDDYYMEIFRLNRMPYPPKTGMKPSYVGHWTNDIVYKRLAPHVLDILREKNPTKESGTRSRKHHQHLTPDLGVPALKDHLEKLIYLMKTCNDWDDFKERLDRVSPKYGSTLKMHLLPRHEKKQKPLAI